MRLTLKLWRQIDPVTKGAMHTYQVDDISPDLSFLQMPDVLIDQLHQHVQEPVALRPHFPKCRCGYVRLLTHALAPWP